MTDQGINPVTSDQLLSQMIELQRMQGERLDNVAIQLTKKQTAVSLQNFNMPFWAMVGLLIKVSIAAIPAAIILAILSGVVGLVATMFLGTLSAVLLGS